MATTTKNRKRAHDLDRLTPRDRLKALLNRELDRLPEALAALPPAARVDVVLKLMPYAFPKVDSVRYRDDDEITWEFGGF